MSYREYKHTWKCHDKKKMQLYILIPLDFPIVFEAPKARRYRAPLKYSK